MTDNTMLPFTESARNEEFTVACIPVTQPLGTFFIASIPHDKLLEITYSDVRRVEKEEAGSIDTMLGIQRRISPSRVKELQQYVNTFDACFPTAIILSIPERCIEYDGNGLRIFSSPSTSEDDEGVPYGKIAQILDGQHRIKGLEGYKGKEPFQLNVSIFVDLDAASEAYIFSVVNQAQTKVNKSLVYDLYSLAIARSPQKLCHQVAVQLNETQGSPFYRKIKRLGVAGPKTDAVAITQAAFVDALMKHISHPQSLATADRDLYLRKKKPPRATEKDLSKMIFRNFMIDERDFELTDIIWNYFSAVKKRWPRAWNSSDQGVMLSKTNGFMALMRFLKDIYIELDKIGQVITEEEFLSKLKNIQLEDSDFKINNYKPGTSGESQLYKDLKAGHRTAEL